ncbi:hypothetical protein Srufu_028950 [Streptomyces libani subsp. rufus]|nr:hypothetical protein Srufu_028950 [Streptomyces libani subsp. rufus]
MSSLNFASWFLPETRGEHVDIVDHKGIPGDIPRSPVWAARVPLPVPVRRKASWRVTLVVIALGSCRAKSASIEQLHTLVWALQDKSSMAEFTAAWEGEASLIPLRKYVPTLEDTLSLCRAEDLALESTQGRYKLTGKGSEYLRLINSDLEILGAERSFLTRIRPISGTQMWHRLGSTKDSRGNA